MATFDRHAGRYADKYFGLTDYEPTYALLLPHLPAGGRFLDIACGPGNVSAFVAHHRPDVRIVGVDLSPAMVREARLRVPGAEFLVADCRRLQDLAQRMEQDRRQHGVAAAAGPDRDRDLPFDAAAFSFGLSYLDDDGAQAFFQGLRTRLVPRGVLLLTSITGQRDEQRLDTAANGDQMFTAWRTPARIVAMVADAGFEVLDQRALPSPANASVATLDLALLTARR
ncbi:class I SAM-dependent methyltransferase [Roseateles amylovorans]|uniref:Class I SAM-dependent methyltransferase n=1 Tax=Roseateles amylovorans TaxID=2978473 RepID=A0ABY6AY40_9BURK|nr:class I SAM-dependent methyltransferase [Roseateles amylovorans]UXH77597.1 class I SAM-dependent methyltransferase [Roseateles amylovorans]